MVTEEISIKDIVEELAANNVENEVRNDEEATSLLADGVNDEGMFIQCELSLCIKRNCRCYAVNDHQSTSSIAAADSRRSYVGFE